MSTDTPAWVRDAVFYQIFPDRFARSDRVEPPGPLEAWDVPPTPHGFKGGDLFGIAERLDDLQELGVTALYLNPIFQAASNHRYHTYDYLSVDPLLGGDAALRELLDACHARGMRVVLDGVFNHASRGFWAFHHVMENGAASPYRNWFHFDAERLARGEPIRAYPSPPQADELRRASTLRGADGSQSLRLLGYRAWWDLPPLPKFNVADPEAREYLLRVTEHWLRFGIDGWRLDVPEEIDDAEFWRDFRRRARAVNPEAYLVGEVWQVKPEWVAGDRFDALMNYPLLEAILGFAAGGHLDAATIAGHGELSREVRALDGPAFERRLHELMGPYEPSVVQAQLNLLDSHDTPRFVSMCGGDQASYRMAVLLQMTLPGAPCIYYGDEIGMQGGMDPACRGAFPVDRSAWDTDLREFVRAAVALRGAHAVLRGDGGYRAIAAHAGAFAFARASADACFVVAVNAGEEAVALDLDVSGARARALVPVLTTPDATGHVGRSLPVRSGRATLELPARSAGVLQAE